MERNNYAFCKYTEKSNILEVIPNLASMTIEYLKCRADLNFEVDFG